MERYWAPYTHVATDHRMTCFNWLLLGASRRVPPETPTVEVAKDIPSNKIAPAPSWRPQTASSLLSLAPQTAP
jgi:hypothetical protein